MNELYPSVRNGYSTGKTPTGLCIHTLSLISCQMILVIYSKTICMSAAVPTNPSLLHRFTNGSSRNHPRQDEKKRRKPDLIWTRGKLLHISTSFMHISTYLIPIQFHHRILHLDFVLGGHRASLNRGSPRRCACIATGGINRRRCDTR